MKPNMKKARNIILIIALLLIAAVTLSFNLGWIKLHPQYQAAGNPIATESPAPTDTPGVPTDTPQAPTEPAASTPVESAPPTQAQFEPGRSVVSVVQSEKAKAEDIQYEEIKAMVAHAVDMAGGFEGLVKDNQTVVIKPNLVTSIDYTLPNWSGKPLEPEVNGTTTDYRVVRAIVELVRQYDPNGKIYVMEGSAMRTKQCMKQLRYTPEYIPGVDEFIAIEEDSGGWRDYNSPGIVKMPVKDGLIASEVYMNKKYAEADVIISVPVLKTHWTEVVSGSIKNVGIGATPATIYGGEGYMQNNRSSGIPHDKASVDKWLHDWYMARPVDFTIVDGLQGIQNGPTPCYDMTGATDIRDDQMNTRLILASRDSVAADTIEALIMEWDPASTVYLGYLEKSGLGNCTVANIRVVGKRVDEVRKDFKGTAPKGKFTDLSAPDVTINGANLTSDGLSVQMSLSADTSKVEVYIDGQYLMTGVPENPSDYTLMVKGIKKEDLKRSIVLEAYDKYLSRSEKKIEVDMN